jgi:hypothetical protein
MEDKEVLIISPYHCASTTLLHNIGEILNKNFINDWDKNNFPDKFFHVRKYHLFKEGMNNHKKFISKLEYNKNIIIIPFRKRSKILVSGFLHALKNNLLNKKFNSTGEWLEYFKEWINEKKNDYWYNIKYINDIKKLKQKTFTKKQTINKNYLKFKESKSTIYILNVNDKINVDFYYEIYNEYYNRKYNGTFVPKQKNITKVFYQNLKKLKILNIELFYNLIDQDKYLNNLFANFDKDYFKIIK